MAIILDGKALAKEIRAKLQQKIATYTNSKRPPNLQVILVGEDPASCVYVRNKEKSCQELGITAKTHRLAKDISQQDLLNLIAKLNADPEVDAILLQLPLPAGFNTKLCLEAISPDKDVDGFHPLNVGKLVAGLDSFVPCTPAGVIEVLRHYNLSTQGKNAIILGRSEIVGKPLALLLLRAGTFGDASVTICHSKTAKLQELCLQADFIFAAIGRPKLIKASMVKKDAVVIDIGINRTEEGLAGDTDFAAIKDIAKAITPVPGGIGPMTIAMLMQNTVKAWSQHLDLKLD